jgi:integrase/recombinase XerD
MRYVSIEKKDEALFKSSKQNERDYMVITTLWETGLRVSELIKLAPQNINFEDRNLAIKGKGGKIRNIDISNKLVMILQLYIKNNKIKARDPIFDLTRQRVYQITKKYANVNPHAFRHGYAINILRKTKNIKFLQKQLGHKSLQTTEQYLQFMLYDEDKKLLDSIF